MADNRVEEILKNIKNISCQKVDKGWIIQAGQCEISVPLATNFEFRMEKPIQIRHIYFGTETGKFKDLLFNISFSVPCKVRISNPDARCYLYVTQEG